MASFLLFVVVPLAYIAFRGFRRPSEQFMQRWAKAFGVEVTEGNRSVIYAYLLRTKRIRTAGALAGLIFAVAYTVITQTSVSFADPLILAAAGYLLGAVVAEVAAIPRPARPRTPAASLVPRMLNAYFPGYALAALRLIPLVSFGLVPIYAIFEERPYAAVRLGVVGFALIAVASVVVAATAEWAMRKVLRRPQSPQPEEILTADDALRSASVHALGGGAIALTLLLVAYQISTLGGMPQSGALRWLFFLLSVFCVGLAWGCWVDLGHPKSWRVRRQAVLEGRP